VSFNGVSFSGSRRMYDAGTQVASRSGGGRSDRSICGRSSGAKSTTRLTAPGKKFEIVSVNGNIAGRQGMKGREKSRCPPGFKFTARQTALQSS
jgi:hypothetical protein